MEIVDLRAQPQHLSLLAKWHQQQWADINPGQTLEQRMEKMQSYLDENLVPSTFVALDKKTVLGSAALVEYDMKIEGCTPWLASVYVHPLFRKQGTGSRLVLHTMAQARAAGIENMYLFTPDRADFYQRLGWNVMSEEPYHGRQVTIMNAELKT